MITETSFDFDGYNEGPIIRLKYNGVPAMVYLDQKKLILDMGYVIIVSPENSTIDQFVEATGIPDVIIPPDEDDSRGAIKLRNAIYSPELVALMRKARQRLKADTFEPGQVEFP